MLSTQMYSIQFFQKISFLSGYRLLIVYVLLLLIQIPLKAQTGVLVNNLSHSLSHHDQSVRSATQALAELQKCYQSRDMLKMKAFARNAKAEINNAAQWAIAATKAADNALRKVSNCDTLRNTIHEAKIRFQHAKIKFSDASAEFDFLRDEDNFTYINTHIQEALDFIKDGVRLIDTGAESINASIKMVENGCPQAPAQ